MAINWSDIEKKAAAKDAASLKKNPKGYVGDVSASVQADKAKKQNIKKTVYQAGKTASKAAQNAAANIKTETAKKTDLPKSTKKSGTYSKKALPKAAPKTLPKATKKPGIWETIKKAWLGSSYVAPSGTSASSSYDSNPYTKAKQDKFWKGLSTEKGASGTFGRTLAGIGEGFVDANTALPSFIASKVTGKDIDLKKSMGLSLPESAAALKDTTAFNVGELGGNLIGYGAQNIVAAPAVEALLANTKVGQAAAKAGTKLANTRVGQLAGEEAMKGLTTGLAKNAIEAGTVGLGQNIGMAAQEGLQGGDFWKDVALNTALDLGVGSALEAVPVVTGAAKSAKKAKTVAEWLENRNAAKSVEVSDLGKLDGEEVVRTAEKAVPTTNTKLTAVSADGKALPKKSKKNLRKTENPVSKAEKAKVEAKELKADAEAEYSRYYEEARQKVEKYISEYKGKGSQTHLVPKNEDATGAAVRHTVSNNDPWYSKALKEYGNNAGVNRNAKELSERLLDEDLRLAKGQQEMIDGETWQYLHDMKDLIESQDGIINKNIKKSLPKPSKSVVKRNSSHTAEEAARVDSYLSYKDESVENFVRKVKNLQDKNVASKLNENLGSVGDRLKNDIKKILGKDVTGYENNINGSAINHIEKRHGVNGIHDRSMRYTDDVSKMRYVIDNYDNVEKLVADDKDTAQLLKGFLNTDGTRSDGIKLSKKIDGTYYVVEAVPDSKSKKLQVVSAYIGDTKKGSTAIGQIDRPKPPRPTSETPNASTSNSNISRKNAEVKLKKPDRKPKTELPKSANGKELKPGGADVLREDMSVEEIAQKYGTYKYSDVPKATDMGDVSQGANTLYYAKMMDDKAKEALLDGVRAGDYWKTTTKNRTVINEAKAAVSENIDETLDSFLSVSKSGKQATSRDIAKGYALAEEYIKKGDYATVENVLADVAMMESEAGRTLQAMRIFKSQSPAGRVKSALKSAEKIGKDRGVKIKVNQKLVDDIAAAKTDAEKLAANKAFAKDVWDQVPPTLGEKLNSWRYLSMLGNPKTHIRNVLGNAIFVPARVISDSIATGMEKILGRKIAKLGGVKSKSIVGHIGSDGDLRKLARTEFKNHRVALESASSKYIESMRPQDAKLYKSKILEGLRNANSTMLENEDQIFMGLNFESAFSQYCKANGKKASEVTGKFRDEAIAYAQRRALEATYRDPNTFAAAISKLKRNFNINKSDAAVVKFGKKAGEIVSESVLPFVKTPANILKRGVEYSPGGVIGGLAKIATAKDAATLMKGIEYFSSGLTGTGVLAAGIYAAKQGYISGGGGEYDKTKAYEQMLGAQDYSVNIGDKTITIDWMAPLSMPFFVGVEAASSMSDGLDLWQTIEALSSLTDPVFEMSMLSGIDAVFDTAFSEGSPLINIVSNAAENYVSQFVPTLSGQIARTATKERKTTLSTAGTKTEKKVNKTLDKLTNKIPGLTELNQPYVDQWGRTDSKKTPSDYAWAAVENLISPGYISEKNETPVDKEIKRLYGELSEEDAKGVIPGVSSSAYKVKYAGVEYTMTEAEFTEYKKTVGQYRYSELQKLFNTKEYKSASAAEKRKKIMNVYEAGTEKGKESYLVGTGKTTKEKYAYSQLSTSKQKAVDETGAKATEVKAATEAVKAAGASNGKAIQKAYALDGYSDKVKSAFGLSDRQIKAAKALKGYDISYDEFEKAAKKIDTNGNGGYTVDELKAYLDNTNKYTRMQKAAIFGALCAPNVKTNPYM